MKKPKTKKHNAKIFRIVDDVRLYCWSYIYSRARINRV